MVIQDPAIGCPAGAGLATSSNKDTHTVSDQEPGRKSKEGCRQSAVVGGHKTLPREPLPEDLCTLNRHSVVPHFQMATAQNVKAAIHARVSSVDRHPRCLSPCSNESSNTESLACFCINKRTYQFNPPPGQLAHPGGYARDGEFSYATSHPSVAPSRMDDHFRKVRVHTNPALPVH